MTCTSTISAPASISSAESAAAPGAVVCLRGGVYNQVVNLSHSGTAGSAITVTSYPGETAILDGTGIPLSKTSDFVHLGGDDITLTNVEVRDVTGRAVVMTGTGDVVANSRVHDVQYNGILAGGPSETISGNEVYNTVMSNVNDAFGGGGWAEAVNTWQSSETLIRDNYIHDNWGEGINFIDSNNGTATGNTLVDNYSVELYVGGSWNITITGGNHLESTTTTYDRSYGHPFGILISNESGLAVNAPHDITITNNTFVHTSPSGAAYALWNVTVPNLVVSGNTIS